MRKIKTIIVDDEKKARDGLTSLLSGLDDVELLASCKNGLEAIDSIEKYQPDLLLLDIQMPGITGFDVLKSISYKPITIFITAFDQYALKAFEVHAVDYLLKPFTDLRFGQALSNALEIIKTNQQSRTIDSLKKLVDSLEQSTDANEAIPTYYESNRLIIRVDGRIELIDYDQIIWIEAYDYYIKIHAYKTFIIKDSLKNINESLPNSFLRVHKSAIINLKHLQSLDIGHSELMAKLKGDVQVKVSRSHKETLMARLSNP